MSTLMQRFAELKAERPEITQADVSRATKAKPPSVNAWFNGDTRSMKLATATAAAQLYGVMPLWLAEGTGSKYPSSQTKEPQQNGTQAIERREVMGLRRTLGNLSAHLDGDSISIPQHANTQEAIMLATMLDTIKDPMERIKIMAACVNLIVQAGQKPALKAPSNQSD